MKDLITEARELIEALHAGEYDDEYIGTGAYLMLDELCDALEKAQEQNKQLLHEVCKLACESVEREKTLAKLEVEVRASLHEAQERDKGCDHCNLIYKLDGASYGTTDEIIDNNFCPMCGARLPVKAGTIGGEIVKHAMKEMEK